SPSRCRLITRALARRQSKTIMTRHTTETPTSTQETGRRQQLCRHPVVRWVWTTIQRVGFWVAVGLPVVYLPLLATGLKTPADGAVFGALLVANVVGLILGHEHNV
ncbi:MAG: hypothetical protein J07HX5_01524, partial [halophilic archaeon J07HX5]